MRLPRRFAPRNDGSNNILEMFVECKQLNAPVNNP
jgi:hypothetical protein